MKYKDYYETLGVARSATQTEIKSAYRKLARKFHPDVSKEAGAEAKFKEINEAAEVLKDPEKRAAYDKMGSNWKAGQDFQPPPGWDEGFEFRGGPGGFEQGGGFGGTGFDASDFFEQMFGRQARAAQGARRQARSQGEDRHAKVAISVEDAFRGAERSISLRMPKAGADGRVALEERRLDVHIPRGIRAGQSLRLSGQGAPGAGGGKSGDLFLEIAFEPHPRWRVDGGDVSFDLPLAPWEAALGATVDAETPDGTVQLTIPKGSQPGKKLRLKGRGLPATKAGAASGDLYAVLQVALPAADDDAARAAYESMASVFPRFAPRR